MATASGIVGLLTLGLVCATAADGQSSIPVVDARDSAVYRAVMLDERPWAPSAMNPSPVSQNMVLVDRTGGPSEAHVYNGFVRLDPILNFYVDESLLASLLDLNKIEKLIPDEHLPIRLVSAEDMRRTVKTPGDWQRWEAGIGGVSIVVTLSVPSYSSDGAAAVVAVEMGYAAPCCPSGYIAYLEFSGGSWEVCGYGGFWES